MKGNKEKFWSSHRLDHSTFPKHGDMKGFLIESNGIIYYIIIKIF